MSAQPKVLKKRTKDHVAPQMWMKRGTMWVLILDLRSIGAIAGMDVHIMKWDQVRTLTNAHCHKSPRLSQFFNPCGSI